MQNPFKLISGKIVYRNKWIAVKEDKVIRPNGEEGEFTYIERSSSIGVSTIPVNNTGEIYLIKQYRYAAKKYGWEIPGGSADSSETTMQSARRELEEETGLTSAYWSELISFIADPGLVVEDIKIFLAKDVVLGKTDESHLADEGIAEIKKFSRKEIEKMILNGDIFNSDTLIGLLYYFNYILGV